MNKSKYPVVLSIAGSDSSGGAGIQADIKTCSALNVYAMTAMTAITAQNTMGVIGIQDVRPDMVYDQIRAVAEDIFPDAVKIGMLSNNELVEVVAQALKDFRFRNIVVDPVLVASSGSSLSGDTERTVEAMIEKLFPLSTVITPNIPETCHILRVDSEFEDARSLGLRLLHFSKAPAVLIKGGHGCSGICADYLISKGDGNEPVIDEFVAERIETPNSHGTGCTLASAIACGLSKGLTLRDAVKEAKEYVTEALKHGVDMNLGNGTGPLDFLWNNRPQC